MSKKFDITAIATQVGAAAVGGGAAGFAVDKILPQLNPGMQGLAMAGLGSVAVAASGYMKQPMLAHLGAGMLGAAGDRMQRHWLGGGNGGADAPTAGIGQGDPDYSVVVDSEIQDYPASGPEDDGGIAGDDNGGVA